MLTWPTYGAAQVQIYLMAIRLDPSAAQPQLLICRRLISGTDKDTRAD